MLSDSPIILGIESSCDETGAALWHRGKISANVVAGQDVHKAYGGVVPELASRAHQGNIVPVVDVALKESALALKDINAVACTFGPGLMGALLVGSSFSKALAASLEVPLIAVNHIEAHVLSHFIEDPKPSFPFLCLVVSGGHTHIFRVDSPVQMSVIGHTIDDAAGEAFDKAAKMLGLPYPGGPLIDKYAQEGDPHAFEFAGGTVPGLNYSFSGFKTSVLYFLQKQTARQPDFIEKNLADICASVQYTIVRDILKKLEKACQETGIRQVAIAGGVAANKGLRQTLSALAAKQDWEVFIPDFSYCTDNAAMVACAGYYKYLAGDFADLSQVPFARAAWSR